jgi:hypothetical protein
MLLLVPVSAEAQLEDTGGETTSVSSGGPGFGVGMETVLTAPFSADLSFAPAGAAALSYDAGQFRVDGLLYLLFVSRDGGADSTAFALGARAFYKLHSTSKADFSVGGGLALGFLDSDPGDGSFRVAIDGAVQIRVWLASNVALNGSAGIGFSVGENLFVSALTGQLMGGFGMIYYFD